MRTTSVIAHLCLLAVAVGCDGEVQVEPAPEALAASCTVVTEPVAGTPAMVLPAASHPAYIWVYAHHYLSGGGTYPTVAELQSLTDTIELVGIPVTLFFDGILMQEVLASPGGPALLARLNGLQASGLLTFGYHGEETHGPNPVPTAMKQADSSVDFTLYDDWDTAFQEVRNFARLSHTYELIAADGLHCGNSVEIRSVKRSGGWEFEKNREGGVKLVATQLGEIAIGCYHGTESPPMQVAYQSVTPVDVMQATVPVTAHVLDGFADGQVAAVMNVGGDGDLF